MDHAEGSSSAELRGYVPHWSVTVEPHSMVGDEKRMLATNRTTTSVKRFTDSSGHVSQRRHVRHIMSTIVTNGTIGSPMPHLWMPPGGRAMLVELSDDPAIPVTRDLSRSTAEQHDVAPEDSFEAVIHIGDRNYPVTVVTPASDVFGHWQWGFVIDEWFPEGFDGEFAVRSLSVRGSGWNHDAELDIVPIAAYVEGRSQLIEAMRGDWTDPV